MSQVSLSFSCLSFLPARPERYTKISGSPSFRTLAPPQVGGIRVRQHANPLRKELQVPSPPPDWRAAFHDPTLPLAVDVGCGSGRHSLMLGRRELGRRNCLGLEIRAKLVRRAQARASGEKMMGRAAAAQSLKGIPGETNSPKL